MGAVVPPGWYPEDETRALRWWNGEQWTEFRQEPPTEGWAPPDPGSVAQPFPRSSQSPPSTFERNNGRRLKTFGVVVGAAVVVLVGGGIAAYSAGHNVVTEAQRVPLPSEGGTAIAGAPGYTTVSGPDGNPLAQGRPWGVACKPIVFAVDSAVPGSLYAQIAQGVARARAQGVDVEAQTPQGYWSPDQLFPPGLNEADVQFVEVFAEGGTPPTLTDGQPEHIDFAWDTRSLGNVDALTSLQATVYLQSVGNDPVKISRAVHQLIAFAQGVGYSVAPHSGITNGVSANTLTKSDLRAIRLMSGCEPPGS